MKLEKELMPPVEGVDTETEEMLEARPLPDSLRYLMVGLLVAGVVGIVIVGYVRQNSVKQPANAAVAGSEDCKDPVTENRLRETLSQSPNDFATLMDWGYYNLTCDKNFPAAVASFQQAADVSTQANSMVKPEQRVDAAFRLGLAYLYSDNLREAQGQFERVLQADGQHVSALFALGVLLMRGNKTAEASVYLKKIVEIDPGGPTAKQAQTMLDNMGKAPKP